MVRENFHNLAEMVLAEQIASDAQHVAVIVFAGQTGGDFIMHQSRRTPQILFAASDIPMPLPSTRIAASAFPIPPRGQQARQNPDNRTMRRCRSRSPAPRGPTFSTLATSVASLRSLGDRMPMPASSIAAPRHAPVPGRGLFLRAFPATALDQSLKLPGQSLVKTDVSTNWILNIALGVQRCNFLRSRRNQRGDLMAWLRLMV